LAQNNFPSPTRFINVPNKFGQKNGHTRIKYQPSLAEWAIRASLLKQQLDASACRYISTLNLDDLLARKQESDAFNAGGRKCNGTNTFGGQMSGRGGEFASKVSATGKNTSAMGSGNLEMFNHDGDGCVNNMIDRKDDHIDHPFLFRTDEDRKTGCSVVWSERDWSDLGIFCPSLTKISARRTNFTNFDLPPIGNGLMTQIKVRMATLYST
jgi:hypothetical protein